MSTYRSKTKPELRVADQDEPIPIGEPPPALNENGVPSWAKLVLGLGVLLTGLWIGVILWGMVKVVELAL